MQLCEIFLALVSIVLELSDQKTQVFLVLITLMRRFSEHTYKVFIKMTVIT
jgi:hypothetical protein